MTQSRLSTKFQQLLHRTVLDLCAQVCFHKTNESAVTEGTDNSPLLTDTFLRNLLRVFSPCGSCWNAFITPEADNDRAGLSRHQTEINELDPSVHVQLERHGAGVCIWGEGWGGDFALRFVVTLPSRKLCSWPMTECHL